MSPLGRAIQVGLGIGVILAIAGLTIPLLLRARLNSDKINCQNHLKDIGLTGMRHASTPGQGLPEKPIDELPPGTIYSKDLTPDQRLSWYVSILNVLEAGGPPNLEPKADTKKRRSPRGLSETLQDLEVNKGWDSPGNDKVAKHRLLTAICPARIADLQADGDQPNNYIAVGGVGVDTPGLPLDKAVGKAGAFRYDTPTPLTAITDGLSETIQFVETSRDVSSWLRGGAPTLRGLDAADTPYLGYGRAFGGCHPGGAYVSRADGSVTFMRDSIDPAVFRAMLTIAGGRDEQPFDAP